MMIKTSLIAAGFAFALLGAGNAADKPELNVYTYDSFTSEWGPGPQIKTAFEAICDCTLKFTTAGDGAALLARVQLEGSNGKADVVLGLDTNLTARATATGLFAPLSRAPVKLDLPVVWDDPVFLPYDWGYFAFVYDNTKLTEVPTSFESLAAAPAALKIVIEDPRSSTPGLGLLMWVKAAYGDRAPEIWAGLQPHILTVTKGWSEAYGMFLNGEADMVLSYTTSPAYHRIAESDASKSAAVFDEGHYMQVEVAGKLKAAPQPELADRFLAFMLSPEFQSLIPATNWMYPAVMPEAGLPEGFDAPLDPAKALLFSASDAAAKRDSALDEWLTALSK
jgi:thiamine transport system substrate-binding protein